MIEKMAGPVLLNDYGFYEISNKPSEQELTTYYADRYYQEQLTTYQSAYSEEELTYLKNKFRLRHHVVETLAGRSQVPPRFLDMGCGEGWALSYFHGQGYEVLGLDYSSYSLEQHNPALRPRLRPGDLYANLADIQREGHQFDVLWLDNVLEHVREPAKLLGLCRAVAAPRAVLVVAVPNDFSPLQNYLLETEQIDRPFWVVLPDHLSYFNPTGLRNLAAATGWHLTDMLGDQPIDVNLLNPATNYVQDKTAGPACHRARVALDNLLMRTAPLPAVAAYYRGLAGVGLGRNIVGFLTLATAAGA